MLRPLPKALWPRSYPLYGLLGLGLGLTLGFASLAWQVKTLEPLQKYYLGSYLRSGWIPANQNFQLVQVETGKGPVFAIDPWVQATGTGKQQSFSITAEGMRAGMRGPRLISLRKVDPDKVHAFLAANIYGGTLTHRFRYSLWFAGIAALLGLLAGTTLDRWNEKRAHEGVQVRGPILRNPREGARKTKGNGVALWLEAEQE
jgi:hypothetical protein